MKPDLQENPSSAELYDKSMASNIHAHEVPAMAASLGTFDSRDTESTQALVSIIDEQARSLVKIRRELAATRAIANDRLQIIKAHGDKDSASPASDVKAELARLHDLLEDMLRSRWRKLGQKLGFAVRLPWEPDGWRSDLVTPALSSGSSGKEFHKELVRLHALVEELLRSRWRKFGQKVGLAAKLPWEPDGWRSTMVGGPQNEGQSQARPARPGDRSLPDVSASHQTDYAALVDYATRMFLSECRNFATDVIFDVGANVGKFGQSLRVRGYCGHIISFEPLIAAHTALSNAAASDSLWDIVRRCAVGPLDGKAQINIAGNSYSSSLLPMLHRHSQAAPESTYNGVEACEMITLDSFIDATFSDPTTTFGLKIDTQGYEGQVLAGLHRNLHRVSVILCEMSVVPLYEGAPTMTALGRTLADLGYRCVALSPEFEDPETGELLQVNGIFSRR